MGVKCGIFVVQKSVKNERSPEPTTKEKLDVEGDDLLYS